MTVLCKEENGTLPSRMHSMIPIVSSWSISPLWSASNLYIAARFNLRTSDLIWFLEPTYSYPHFKGPTEFFFWCPGTDKVVDHDELKEVNIPVAISIQGSECSNL